MYPVKRASLDFVHACGSQQFPQFFQSDVYGICEQFQKIGVEVDMKKLREILVTPLFFCLPKDNG